MRFPDGVLLFCFSRLKDNLKIRRGAMFHFRRRDGLILLSKIPHRTDQKSIGISPSGDFDPTLT